MKRSIEIAGWSALVALALGSLGCTVTADPIPVETPVAYADVGVAPVEVDIATYPQAYFGGHAVYLYRDHWYYRDGGRWAYYRHEPPELYRRRGYVRQAPPAARRYYAHPARAPRAR